MELRRKNSTDSEDSARYFQRGKMDAKEYDSLLGVKRDIPYPKSVFFIFLCEFCERFSYYGMRTVLTLYLRNALQYTDNGATVIFHTFVMLCYMTPVFGAYIADSLLGKFRTILYLSIIYAIGNVTLSTASIPTIPLPHIEFSLLGLGLIALGTGGIKPCVSAFGGDQFIVPGQEKALEQFFFIFYFTVNAGSVLSTFLTPVFRKDVSCFGSETCYPLAFGVPAALMITSLVIFVCGKSFYKIRMPEKNIGVEIIKCMAHALKNRNSNPKAQHWLDNANDKYDQDFLEDVKQLFSVFYLFIPLPVFWSLFDQQGSQWTLQATRMNGHVFDWWTIKPDQMQLVNSLLVILLIPIFERFVYPLLAKCNVLKKPLQRMTLGGLLAALSFVIAGVVELQIQPTYPVIPGRGESSLNFVNTVPCPLTISLSDEEDGRFYPSESIFPFENVIYNALRAPINYSVTIEPYNQSESCLLNGQPFSSKRRLFLSPQSEQSLTILIKVNEKPENGIEFLYSPIGDDLKKSQEGNAKIRAIYSGLPLDKNFSVALESASGYNYKFALNSSTVATETIEVEPEVYLVRLKETLTNGTVTSIPLTEIFVDNGGSYILALFPKTNREYNNSTSAISGNMFAKLYTLTNANTVNMLLQLPQYIIITLGELLFALTGYDFSFSQAPNSMKTVMQSVWLLTTAVGSIIVIAVVESGAFTSIMMQFFFFAGLMFLSFIVFVILANRYKTRQIEPSSPLFKRKSALPPMKDFLTIDETKFNNDY